jgi:nucleotide-binding universal stress UspA family protein
MPYHHLLVPSDGTERSQEAVRQAVALAGALGARITFLHAQPNVPVPVLGMGEMLDPHTMDVLIEASRKDSDRILEAAAAAAQEAGVPFGRERATSDLPHQAIVETAERLGCDLVVMASHGRGGLSGLLLGSETQRVLVESKLPVLVVR